MARIAGVNIPTKKRVEIALTYIHGIGTTSAQTICAKAGVPDERRVNDLSEEELTRLRDIIDQDFLVEGDLRRQTSMNIKRYLDLGLFARASAPPQSAGSWSAHAHKCTHPQRPGKGHRW